MDEFKPGEQVQLKSDGPVMTVAEKREGLGEYECQWFSGEKLNEGYFPAAALSPAADTGEGARDMRSELVRALAGVPSELLQEVLDSLGPKSSDAT